MAKIIYGYHGIESGFADGPRPQLFAGAFADGSPATRFAEVELQHGYGRNGFGDFGTGLIVTPGQILDKANLVDSFVSTLDRDVDASKLDDATKNSWADFYDSWVAFYNGIQGVTGFLSRLWAGTMDQVEQFEAQANAWRAKLAGAGAAISTPGLDPGPSSFDISKIVKGAGWVIGGLVALKALSVVLALKGSGGSKVAMNGYGGRRRRRRR